MPRQQYETPFPDLPTLHEAICEMKNIRLRAVREQRERMESERDRRDQQEHPENYFDVSQMIHDFVKKKGIEVVAPKKKATPFCEKCAAYIEDEIRRRMEAFTAADYRALAIVAEQREALKVQEVRERAV
jgi:hypothetical protein